TFAVEPGELLDQGHIVEHQRTVGSHAQRVGIGFPGRTGLGRRGLGAVVPGVLMICMLRHHISYPLGFGPCAAAAALPRRTAAPLARLICIPDLGRTLSVLASN